MSKKLAPISITPLYFGSDIGVKDYFSKNKSEIDALTGASIIIYLAVSVQQEDADDVASAISSKRYPGLRAGDFPCLWIEKDGSHFVLHLSDEMGDVKDTIRAIVDAVAQAHTFNELEEIMKKQQNNPEETSVAQTPAWFPIAGFVSGFLTLIFFMYLVLADKPVSQERKWAEIVVLALGMGLASSFIGGTAKATGVLKIPYMKDNPVKFGIIGGVAVTFIFVLIGYYTYVKP